MKILVEYTVTTTTAVTRRAVVDTQDFEKEHGQKFTRASDQTVVTLLEEAGTGETVSEHTFVDYSPVEIISRTTAPMPA